MDSFLQFIDKYIIGFKLTRVLIVVLIIIIGFFVYFYISSNNRPFDENAVSMDAISIDLQLGVGSYTGKPCTSVEERDVPSDTLKKANINMKYYEKITYMVSCEYEYFPKYKIKLKTKEKYGSIEYETGTMVKK